MAPRPVTPSQTPLVTTTRPCQPERPSRTHISSWWSGPTVPHHHHLYPSLAPSPAPPPSYPRTTRTAPTRLALALALALRLRLRLRDDGQQRGQGGPGIGGGVLDDADELAEVGAGGVADDLVQPALARGDDDARLGAEAGEGEGHLLGVAAAHGVGEDVDAVAGGAGVEGRLGDADVGLDAHEDDVGGAGLGLGELLDEGGDPHAEEGLVGDGAAEGRGEVRGHLGDGVAQAGAVLRRGVDGDLEGGGGTEYLSGGEDAGEWEAEGGGMR